MRKLILLILFAFSYNLSAEHSHKIYGTISNEKGESVVGATVRISGSPKGTIADQNGNYQLKSLEHDTYVLVFSAVGYAIKEDTVRLSEKDIRIDVVLYESALNSETIVVTGTRTDKLYDDSAVRVSVLDSKVIESTNSVSLKEGLSFQPGLRVETNCQNCGFSQIRLNGLDGQYSQVLIDGKPVYSALNGVYGLDQIPTNIVDRIEVVRGGGSALYGSSAVGGVVNIITKDPVEDYVKADIRQGFTDNIAPDRSLMLSGSVISDNQKSGITFFGNYRDRSPLSINNDDFSEITSLTATSIGTKLYYEPTLKSRFELEYHNIRDERRGGNKFNLRPHQADIAEWLTHNTNMAQLNFESYLNDRNKLSAYVTTQITDRESYYGTNQDLNAYGNTDNTTIVSGLVYNNVNEDLFFGDHVFTIGTEHKYDKIRDVAPGYNRNINQNTNLIGVYAQDDWSLNKDLNIVYGARIDKHNFIENIILSPRLNFIWKFAETWNLRGAASAGYRAPQAFDEDLHIATVGGELMLIQLSPELKEERSLSYNFSVDKQIMIYENPVNITLEYFRTDLYDTFVNEFLQRDENNNLVMEKRNGHGATVQGMTAEAMVQLSQDFQMKLGFTSQTAFYDTPVEWSENTLPTRYILRSPNNYGYANVNWQISDRFFSNISAVYTGSMRAPHFAGGLNQNGETIENDKLEITPSFLEINTTLEYLISENPNIRIGIGLFNMFNQFQNDFDLGANRDAGYVYGPERPFTSYFFIKTGL